MDYSLSAIFSVLILFQLFFVGLYLFTNKNGDKRNNRILALFFFLLSLNFADIFLRSMDLPAIHPVIHLIDEGFFLLYGPLFYFYTNGVVFIVSFDSIVSN